MKLSYALLLAAAGAPLAASAQADRAAPPPYRSVFAGYVATPAATLTPDQAWRQSNRDVGAAATGHSGHMHHGAGTSTGQDAAGHAAMDHGKMEQGKADHGKASPAKEGHDEADHGKMRHGSQPQSEQPNDSHAGHGKQPAGTQPAPPAIPPASPAPARHQHQDH